MCGKKLLQDRAKDKKFSVQNMIEVLRDEDSGINRPGYMNPSVTKTLSMIFVGGDFPTSGSQVSILGRTGSFPCHWFTATPVPTWYKRKNY